MGGERWERGGIKRNLSKDRKGGYTEHILNLYILSQDFCCCSVLILAIISKNIPAVLLQAMALGFIDNNDYVFITMDLIPGMSNTVEL